MNTFLFDLDGTLLSLNMEAFERQYFKELASVFSDLMDNETFIKSIWKATKEMVQNLENKTNEEVFMAAFGEIVKDKLPVYQARFDKFYDTEFLKVRSAVNDIPFMKQCINLLRKKNYDIVIATNPLFPLKAIHHRIRWAGFNPEDFNYISSFETNHYCKPQIEYYKEVLKDINRTPEECLMVGNDVQEDLVARRLGIKTFLVTDNLLHRTNEKIVSDYIGNYEDFYNFIKELPKAE